MKILSQRTMALLVISSTFIFAAASCKKSNSGSSTNNNAQLSASVNGSSWANSFPLGAVYSVGASNFQILGIQLKGGDSTGLGLIFLAPITVNQMISSDSGWVDVEYVNSDSIFDGGHTAGHSVLTVTSYDPVDGKIAGTFSGVLYNISGGTDSLIIANGSFTTSYTTQ
jgi:hypothetical protein